MSKPDEEVRTRDVVEYAATLRARAQRKLATTPDADGNDAVRLYPYAEPYSPSEAAARKLSANIGPAAALKELARRAKVAEDKMAEEEAIAEQSMARWRRMCQKADIELQQQREQLTPGQRIDQALAALKVVSTVPAAGLSPDMINGGERSNQPRITHDTLEQANKTATLAARSIEGILDRSRRRVASDQTTVRDADERLRRLAADGLTIQQIAIADPSLGGPGRVRDRLRELGIDERTGRPIRDAA